MSNDALFNISSVDTKSKLQLASALIVVIYTRKYSITDFQWL